MATIGKYLQAWQLEVNTYRPMEAKTVSATFHLNNKDAKRELNVNHKNETLVFTPRPNTSEYRWTSPHVSPTPQVVSQKVDIMRRTREAACWLWAGCWSNNAANSQYCPGPFSSWVYCAPVWYSSCHSVRLIHPVINDALQVVTGCLCPTFRHPTCWASSQRSHTVSSTPCHGSWTYAPSALTYASSGYARRHKSRHLCVSEWLWSAMWFVCEYGPDAWNKHVSKWDKWMNLPSVPFQTFSF